ncbi:Glycosyltransferase involved in cell wall bisynthesis [Proteiniborus ethanoligenes]|uniref:Glycosyltransferase involved in cell wall bisynthesis n=1 Tax=Proteiniborus ethanoligenes TaxID=415015 RepID=A0A1H3SHN9_9FIRM|nr:glycosyltransferase family 4 protein [Proteiniborus ethanoligenes]SDZ36629.1 Glycosyltransferase involved in cell wall bisynthesis [Proteiniborus ethanoligenes]
MKILHLISGGDTGGAKTHVLALLSQLQKQIDVKIICLMKEDFYYEAKERGINIEVFQQRKRYDLFVVKRIINEIKTDGYEIIHCHGARANFVASLVKLRYKIPVVTTIHSDYKLDFQDNTYKNLVYTKINSLALKFMDYYIGVSDSFKSMLINRGFNPDLVFTVYNGIDMSLPNKITNKHEFLERYNIIAEEDTILIGILARLHPVKGIDVLLKGAKRVLVKRQNVKFLIGGDGAEDEKLKELAEGLGIRENIHFLGFINEPNSFFNMIDINTVTSYSESFPYVIMEGGAFKKPIVASNVGGIGDLVIQGETGFLFEAGDDEGLAEQLMKLIDNEDLRRKLGEELYKAVREKYSAESMANSHITIYRKILDRQVK